MKYSHTPSLSGAKMEMEVTHSEALTVLCKVHEAEERTELCFHATSQEGVFARSLKSLLIDVLKWMSVDT